MGTMRTTIVAMLGVLAAGPALAGRGSSPGAIKSAIASDSGDVITSELERAEHLVCPGCVPLVRPLLDHPDRRVRQVAAWWLARRGLGPDLVATMSERLSAADDPVRARNAADVLGELRRSEAIEPLGAAVANVTLAVEARVAAAQALGSIGDPAAVVPLGRALAAREASVRGAAVAGLRELRGFQDSTPALPLLADADEWVRTQAVLTVGATRKASPAAVPALVKLLGDPSSSVRKKAAWALGEIGAPAAVAGPALQRAAREDRDPLVRSLASAASSRLTR
jgi:HEAT repeat protein